MSTTSNDYETVRAELRKVDHLAYKLYKTTAELRLRGLCSALTYFLEVTDVVTSQRDHLKPSSASHHRQQLSLLLRDDLDTLRGLEGYIRTISGRNGPPPTLRASMDIQDAIVERAKDLLHFNLELVNEPSGSQGALPPAESSDTRGGLSRSGSKRDAQKEPMLDKRKSRQDENKSSHYRKPSYGGVPLDPLLTANLGVGSSSKPPASPYQPTVEEVPDEGTPDGEKSSFIEEYHITTPDDSGDSVANASSVAAQMLSETQDDEDSREGRPAVVLPDEARPKSTTSSHDRAFLDPSSAFRPKRSPVREQDAGQKWMPSSQEDFGLFDTTDEEGDDERSGTGTRSPYRVESLSAANTPIDRVQMPPPRRRGSSYVRGAPGSDVSSSKMSPLYSPGHSPWIDSKDYVDRKGKGPEARDSYSQRASPMEPPAGDIPKSRRRTMTQGSSSWRTPRQVPYPVEGAFGAYGAAAAYHFYGGRPDYRADEVFSTFLRDDPAAVPPPIGLRPDDSMRVHPGDSPRERPTPILSVPPSLPTGDSMRVHPGDSPKASPSQTPKQKAESVPTEKFLIMSLEDVFAGGKKKLAVKDPDANLRKYIEIPIRPGVQAGTRYKFTEIWFDNDKCVRDLHFILQYKPHEQFTRVGDDLHHTIDIDLLESLCGWERRVDTICGQRIKVSASEPTGPNWKDAYAGLGMPRNKQPKERGDLVVKVNIRYPARVSERQREVLKSVFGAA